MYVNVLYAARLLWVCESALMEYNYFECICISWWANGWGKEVGLGELSVQVWMLVFCDVFLYFLLSVYTYTLEYVEDFTYLGSHIGNETQKEIKIKQEALQVNFVTSGSLNNNCLKTKIRIYNSNVEALLLCGSECRRATKTDMRKVDVFRYSCLRKICNIGQIKCQRKNCVRGQEACVTRSCVEERLCQWKAAERCLEVDPDWEEKERQTKEHLAKNRDAGTEGDGSLLGWNRPKHKTGLSGSVWLPPQPGRRG